MSDPAYLQPRDRDHLNILSILHYVYAGLLLIGLCIGSIYVAFGTAMFSAPDEFADAETSAEEMQVVGGILLATGGCTVILSIIFGVLIIYAGYCLGRQRHWMYCMVIAAIECINIPLGTILGVFTLIVLSRPSVKKLFGRPTPGDLPGPTYSNG